MQPRQLPCHLFPEHWPVITVIKREVTPQEVDDGPVRHRLGVGGAPCFEKPYARGLAGADEFREETGLPTPGSPAIPTTCPQPS